MGYILMTALAALMMISEVFADAKTEAEFVERMSTHLEDEISLLDLALQKSNNAEIHRMVQFMKHDQVKNRAKLKKLKTKRYGGGAKGPVAEVINPDPELLTLQKLEGREFDRTFLELMSKKHKEAIQMTSKLIPGLEKSDVHHLAVKIVKKQGNEIDKIERIKNSL